MSLPSTFEALIAEATSLNLYKKLIAQLNKDLLFANIDLELNEETLPTSLKLVLQETVFHLIQNNFSSIFLTIPTQPIFMTCSGK